jgi:hypothetical protein
LIPGEKKRSVATTMSKRSSVSGMKSRPMSRAAALVAIPAFRFSPEGL